MTDAVGPRELQNFNLQGTVTKPAEPAPTPHKATPPQAERTSARSAPAPARSQPAVTNIKKRGDDVPAAAQKAQPRPSAERAVEAPRQTPPASSVTVALPKLDNNLTRGGATTGVPASSPALAPDSDSGNLASEHTLSILPWLIAALALAVGLGFLFWRSRFRESYAGAGRIESYLAPELAPAPMPTPAPRPAPIPPKVTPSIPGVVSTRLRPWIDIAFQPLRCIVEDDKVTIQFELELFNSGSAPARAVLIEASLFNAGPSQDRDIGDFFANPVGEGERIVAIPPLKRMTLRTQVVTERRQVQVYEVGGRQVFVPLIAFNALYKWSTGDGQSSVSYLLGRDTKGEKMAPFRIDLGPRVFRGVGAHPLPEAVRN